MAHPAQHRIITYAPRAIEQLEAIWRWNAEKYGATHADQYLASLRKTISSLAAAQHEQRAVRLSDSLRYLLIRRYSARHGHVIVFRSDAHRVEIAYIFHTAQDWKSEV